MILNRTSKDLQYTSDGDFMLSPSKGLALSGMGNNQLLGEIIYRRLKSSFGEWRSEFGSFADLKEAIGMQLNETSVEFLLDLIRRSLAQYELLSNEEFVVVPAGAVGTKVAISIAVYSEINQSNVLLSIVYDSRDNDFVVKFLEEKAYS